MIRHSHLRAAVGIFVAAIATPCFPQEKAAPPSRPMPLAKEQIDTILSVIDRLKLDYVRSVDGDEVTEQALKGLLERIDPEGGEYFTKAEFDDFERGYEGVARQLGIGVVIHARADALHLFPIQGGPAELAGVRSGDTLRSIDGTPTADLTPHAAAKMLRGDSASHVIVGVTRGSSTELLRFDVVRRIVQYPPVRLMRPEPDLVVLQIPTLADRTLEDAARALNDEWGRRPYKGILLDLRQNSGGLLESAIGLSAIFLQPGALVVTTTGRIAQANQAFHATPADYMLHGGSDPLANLAPALRRLPLVVLVDEATASGAEIVAAALRDHGRAVIVGHVTYGRGSIQTLMALPSGGAMKITTAFYTTPSGSALQGQGIKPDVVVNGDDAAQALQAGLAELRKRLPPT